MAGLFCVLQAAAATVHQRSTAPCPKPLPTFIQVLVFQACDSVLPSYRSDVSCSPVSSTSSPLTLRA